MSWTGTAATRRLAALFLCTALLAFADGLPTVLDDDEANAVVKLEFGLAHTTARDWTGVVTASSGEEPIVWGWHFSRPDRTLPGGRFELSVREYSPQGAPYRPPYPLANGRKILPNGVFFSLKAAGPERIRVQTNNGEIAFDLSELRDAGRMTFLDGDAAAVYTPAVRALTRGEATQHDFPAATFVNGDLYVAWTAYHNEGNALYLAKRSAGAWTTLRVTPEWGDYYGAAVVGDAEGRVHVLFSECRDERWRLLDRVYDPKVDRWTSGRYMAPAGDRQYFPQAVQDAKGRPWAVWQEFAQDNLEIMAAHFEDGRWSAPLRVSASPANDWAPAIAAAPDGSVWFAWDSFDQGNYDVFVRSFRGDRLEAPVQVTHAPTRDAYASIAVDSHNRVWVAWAEAGPKWGKDWGVLGKPGTQLRASSRVRLVRFADGRWTEPREPLEAAVPAWMADRHEYPRVVIGANDAPYVFFRKAIHRLPILEHGLKLEIGDDERVLQPWYDTIRGMSSEHVIGFDGARWLGDREVPLSDGGAFVQLTPAKGPDGTVVVWPTDGRTYEDPHFRTSQLRWADFALDAKLAESESMQAFASPAAGPDPDIAAEMRDLERVRAVRWQDAEPLRLFRGDMHRHTDISADSELDGDILYAYRYALDPGALDFLAVTDHSGAERMHFYKYQWWRSRQLASMFYRPGRFVTFFGYERTVTFPGGHRNIISTRRDLQPTPISDEEFTGTESWAERLYPALRAGGDIAIPHTTAGGGGTDWRDGDPAVEPLVEIFQALRGSYEEPSGPANAGGKNYEAGFVWNAWAMGRKLGVIANSDHNSTHQSYACVYAPRLDREAIHQALKKRLTFAATDNIVLQVEATAKSGVTHKMGEEMAASGVPRFDIEIAGTAPLTRLEIIRNGKIVHTDASGRQAFHLSYVDNAAPAGESYYHVRVVEQNGQLAWSSPIWISRRAP